MIEEYQAAVDNSVLAFIKRWRTLVNPDYKKKVKITVAKVNNRAQRDMLKLTGVDTTGFDHALSGNALKHIDKGHGVNGEANRVMSDDNDIARIGYVLENYDAVDLLRYKKSGDVVLSSEHCNSDGTRAKMVEFKKRVDSTYYVIEAVPDTKAHQVRVVSAYFDKINKSTDQVLNDPKNGPQLTPEAPHGANALVNDTVSQPATDVNSESSFDSTGRTSSDGIDGDKTAGYNKKEPVSKWAHEALVAPEEGSVAYGAVQTAKEYGVEVYVVADDAWNKHRGENAPEAFASAGKIYMHNTIPERCRGMIAPHEITHVMRQMGFKPYLDFLDTVPDRIDFSNENIQLMLEQLAEKYNLELFGYLSTKEVRIIYDELSATIYGSIAVDNEDLDYVRDAFYDFDGYAAELRAIHEQFKNREVKENGSDEATADTERDSGEMEERHAGGEGEKRGHISQDGSGGAVQTGGRLRISRRARTEGEFQGLSRPRTEDGRGDAELTELALLKEENRKLRAELESLKKKARRDEGYSMFSTKSRAKDDPFDQGWEREL